MAWLAGTFARVGGATNWGDDRDASIEIEAGLHDTNDEDLADGINACIAKDGTNAMTAALNLNSQWIVNVKTPTLGGHAANKAYVDANVAGIIFASADEILIRTGAAAPTGWMIQTTDNKAVKIINTTPGGDGGSFTFDTALVNAKATGAASAPAGTAASGVAEAYTQLAHTHDHTIGVQFREFNVIVKT